MIRKALREWVDTPLRMALVVLGSVVLASLLVTGMDRRPPVSVVDGQALSPAIAAGDPFNGVWTVTVNRHCSGTAHRWLQSIANPAWKVSLPPIEPDFREMVSEVPATVHYPVTTFEIPMGTPEGEMAYHVVLTYVCWHLGDAIFPINVIYPPMTFLVTEGRK